MPSASGDKGFGDGAGGFEDQNWYELNSEVAPECNLIPLNKECQPANYSGLSSTAILQLSGDLYQHQDLIWQHSGFLNVMIDIN